MAGFKSFLVDFVEEETRTMNADDNGDGVVDRGFVDAFRRAQAEIAGDGNFFTDEQLVIAVQDFFTGGSGTMSKTLAFAALYMARHQDAQDRARDEMDKMLEVEGSCQFVVASDRARLPLTEATLLEVQRLASVLPIAPPRMVTKHIKIGRSKVEKKRALDMANYSLFPLQAISPSRRAPPYS